MSNAGHSADATTSSRAARRPSVDATVINTVSGWIDKASNQLAAAKQYVESPYRSSEAIQAAQECIELSVKSVLTLLDISYPRAHEWPADGKAFDSIAKQIKERQLIRRIQQENLGAILRLPRLLMLLNFWARFYLIAKYGFEVEYLASARELFELPDATLAVRHADECWRAALELRHVSVERMAFLLSDGET